MRTRSHLSFLNLQLTEAFQLIHMLVGDRHFLASQYDACALQRFCYPNSGFHGKGELMKLNKLEYSQVLHELIYDASSIARYFHGRSFRNPNLVEVPDWSQMCQSAEI